MKKALLIVGLMASVAIPVTKADVDKEPIEEVVESTVQDFEKVQEAIVAVIQEAMAEVADDSEEPKDA